jgi:hypothetical protein
LLIYNSGIGFESLVVGEVADDAATDRFIAVVTTPKPPH